MKINPGYGSYENAGCTKAGGEKRYEWYSGVLRSHFTTKIKEGVATLETVKGAKVVCQAESGAGSYTSAKTVGGFVIRFTGCEMLGAKCSSAGVEGEIALR